MAEKLQVVLQLVNDQYKREAREAARATSSIGDAATSATTGTSRLGGGLASIGKAAAIAGTALAAAGVVDFARDSIMAASDLEESVNAVNVVFGEAASAIHEFGKTSVDEVGLAAVNVNNSATVLGSALINAGFDAETAAGKVIDLTTRASDMASVFNTSVPDALQSIQAALRGETDPIEKYGVSLSAAAVEAEAAALGFKKVDGEFDNTAKSAGRLSLIMKQTDRVSGDFKNTSDSTSNTLKKMNERFTEMKARIGTALMPAFKSLLDVAEDSAPIFEDVALAVADLFTEIKPLIDAIGGLIDAYMAAKGAGEEWSGSTNPLVAGFGEYISHIGPMAVLTGNYTDAARAAADVTDQRLNPSMKEAGEKTGDAAKNAKFMADAVKDDMIPAVDKADEPVHRLADAQQHAAAQTKLHLDQVIALTNKLAAQINPALNAYQALQDLEEAHKNAEDAARKHGKESEEAALAQLELAEQVAIANGALAQFGLDADDSVAAVATALGITEEAARKLLDTLGLFDGLTYEVLIKVRQVNLIEQGVIPEGQGITIRPPVILPNNTDVQERQHGGTVTAGTPYLVGERGPEILWPSSNGMIWPNSALSGLGRSVEIHVNSPTNNLAQDLQYAALLANVATLN